MASNGFFNEELISKDLQSHIGDFSDNINKAEAIEKFVRERLPKTPVSNWFSTLVSVKNQRIICSGGISASLRYDDITTEHNEQPLTYITRHIHSGMGEWVNVFITAALIEMVERGQDKLGHNMEFHINLPIKRSQDTNNGYIIATLICKAHTWDGDKLAFIENSYSLTDTVYNATPFNPKFLIDEVEHKSSYTNIIERMAKWANKPDKTITNGHIPINDIIRALGQGENSGGIDIEERVFNYAKDQGEKEYSNGKTVHWKKIDTPRRSISGIINNTRWIFKEGSNDPGSSPWPVNSSVVDTIRFLVFSGILDLLIVNLKKKKNTSSSAA